MTTANPEHENRSDTHDDPSNESTNERQRPSYDDVNVPVVVLVGVVSMVLTFVTIWFVEGVYYQWKNGLVTTERPNEVEFTIQKEFIDKQKMQVEEGVAAMNIAPIHTVIDTVVEEFNNQDPSHQNESAEDHQHDDGDHEHDEEKH